MRAWVVVGIVVVALIGLVMAMATRTRAVHAAPRRRPGAPPRRQRIPAPEIDLRERTGGQCPRCGRAEAVTRSQRNRTLTSWRCGLCDHRWDVADGEPWPDVMSTLPLLRVQAPIADETP